jgi:hypothetical protein
MAPRASDGPAFLKRSVNASWTEGGSSARHCPWKEHGAGRVTGRPWRQTPDGRAWECLFLSYEFVRRFPARPPSRPLSLSKGSRNGQTRKRAWQRRGARLSLLPLWEKVDWREAPRRMRGVGRNEASEVRFSQCNQARTMALRPTPLIRPRSARPPSPTRGEGRYSPSTAAPSTSPSPAPLPSPAPDPTVRRKTWSTECVLKARRPMSPKRI